MKMLQEYWASTVIFIGIFSQCGWFYFFILAKKKSFLQLNCRYSKANNFSKLCLGLFKIIAERIHIFQVAQGTGFEILIRNYL